METIIAISIAIVILGIIFLCMFRQQISEKVKKIKSIGKGGVVFEEDQEGNLKKRSPRDEAEELIRHLDSELMRETEALIKTEFAKRGLSNEEAMPVLMKYFAALYIEYLFTDVYRIIWGSQINLLDHLNTQVRQPRETLKIFYDLGSSQYPDIYKNYSYDQWLGFLKGQVLLREDNGLFGITIRGREFLLYLTRTGLSRNKAG